MNQYNKHNPVPGISRQSRTSDEGLRRLDAQLGRGIKIKHKVLSQWILRYGDAARKIIQNHGQLTSELESVQQDLSRMKLK